MSSLSLVFSERMHKQPSFLPNTLSIFRMFLSPVLYLQLVSGGYLAFPIFLLAILSDLLDGKMARRFKGSSMRGTALDASADFLIIVTGFSYFVSVGLVSPVLPVVMDICFLQYVATLKSHVNNPLGRYVGSILYGLLTLLILLPSPLVGIVVTVSGVSYIIAALFSRFVNAELKESIYAHQCRFLRLRAHSRTAYLPHHQKISGLQRFLDG